MYINGLLLLIGVIAIALLYAKVSELDKILSGIFIKVSNLEKKISNLDSGNGIGTEEDFIKRETKNWIEFKEHLYKRLPKEGADKAWKGATNDESRAISASKWVKDQEKDLPTKEKFSGLLLEDEFYDGYMFTKIMKNLSKK